MDDTQKSEKALEFIEVKKHQVLLLILSPSSSTIHVNPARYNIHKDIRVLDAKTAMVFIFM